MDFHEIRHLSIFTKLSAEKSEFNKNPARITGAFHADQYTGCVSR
jgi:hypothetical protein